MHENHHLEKRGGVWYFRLRHQGKQFYRRASKGISQARTKRDQWLDEFENYGDFLDRISVVDLSETEFVEVVAVWSKKQEIRIKQGQIKNSTWRDWRSVVNNRILPFMGSLPIGAVDIPTIERFLDSLNCGPKRINNILVPVRSIFKYAKRQGYIAINPMDDIDNLKLEQPDISPFDTEEMHSIIHAIPEQYKAFTITAFFTGMRFGEIAALRWESINFKRRLIQIRETLVYGEIGRTKTMRSKRDIVMLMPVYDALASLEVKGKFVFLDREGALLTPDHYRKVIWKPALKKAEIEYRPPIQTRHTFATLAIDSGEALGWVQKMLGHGSLQMIYTRYYSWVKQTARSDGSAFEAKSLLKSL